MMIRNIIPYIFNRKRIKEFPLLSRHIPHGKTVIAHSGHRDLLQSDLPRIKRALNKKLLDITAGTPDDFMLVSGIANGADLLIASRALKMGIKVLLLLLPGEGDEARVEKLKGINKSYKSLIDTLSLAAEIDSVHRDAIQKGIPPSTGSKNNTPYSVLAGSLVNIATYLIVLWDGVDTGKEGGTSDVVNMAMEAAEGKHCKAGTLYQLIVPRKENRSPLCGAALQRQRYFPPPDKMEWAESCFPQAATKRKIPWWTGNVIYNENFWRFILPLFWVLLTVIFGTWGFLICKAKPLDYPGFRNAFFNAVNLLTFNSSASEEASTVLILDIARFGGLFFFINAFVVAFLLAIGGNNKNLIRFFFWNWFWKDRICMITGLNSVSYLLAITLKKEKQEVMIIDKDPDPNMKTEAAKRGIRVVNGSPQSSTFLRRNLAESAHTVYLLEGADADNIRTLQELDLLWVKESKRKRWRVISFIQKVVWRILQQLNLYDAKPNEKKHCYIQLKDERAAEFVGKLKPLYPDVEVRTLNFHEAISRKLLIRYPIYRQCEDAEKPAEILLFGFGEMGKHLLVTLLHTIQLKNDHHVNITVFAQDVDTAQTDFYQQYPCLWYNPHENLLYERPFTKDIRQEIFPKGSITFKELPASDATYYNDDSILRALKEENIISAYFCLEDALQGAAYLHGFLGKIALRQFNLQIFCYCNLADESEFENISHVLNKQLPYTPVILFGQLVDECRILAKRNTTIDDLPALINYWYARKSVAEWEEPAATIMQKAREAWKELSYSHKESNRRAADHIWVKLRYTSYTLEEIKQALNRGKTSDACKALFDYFSAKSSASGDLLFELLAKTEQHRWCAEKLLNGFLPMQDYGGTEDADTLVKRWNSDRAYKNLYQLQKLHIDLIPYHKLPAAEKNKDQDQINGIPYFIHVLMQNNIL